MRSNSVTLGKQRQRQYVTMSEADDRHIGYIKRYIRRATGSGCYECRTACHLS